MGGCGGSNGECCDSCGGYVGSYKNSVVPMEDVVALIEDVIAHLGDNLVRGGENGGSQGSASDFWSCGSNPPLSFPEWLPFSTALCHALT